MLARGSLGNPWLFERLLGARDAEPTRDEVCDELAGSWTAPSSTWARSARAATCASSTPGTSSAWAAEGASRTRCVRRRAGTAVRRSAPRPAAPGATLPRTSRPGRAPAHPAGVSCRRTSSSPPKDLEKLKAELEDSRPKRREVAARIKEAREFGDITENSEYDDAKNEQAMLEARIAHLEEKLRSAQVIDAADLTTDRSRSARCPRQGREDRQVGEVHIVGSAEANPSPRRSSPTSRRSARR